MEKIVNACAWLANLANASKQYQIWCASYHLIASWCPYKEITWYKQSNMCLSLVCACLVLLGSYEFQSLYNLARAWYFTDGRKHSIGLHPPGCFVSKAKDCYVFVSIELTTKHACTSAHSVLTTPPEAVQGMELKCLLLQETQYWCWCS